MNVAVCGNADVGAVTVLWVVEINPLKKKHRLLYLKVQFVPRSEHFSSRL